MKSQTPENQPKAVCFYRVSTQRQQNDRQIEDVQRYCNAYGYSVVKEFQEIISGASNIKDRKELREMLEYVQQNKPDFVICSELSRLARSQDALTIIQNWTELGVCFISLKENIRTLDADGKTNPMTTLLLGILQAVNIFELETVKYRTVSGLAKTVNSGVWVGNVPYGYDKTGEKQQAKLVINDSEAQTVKYIYQKYLQGWGSSRIASTLNRQGKTTKEGKIWREQTVYKLITNPLYVGRRQYKGEEMQTPDTQIIDDVTYASVQERIKTQKALPRIDRHQKHEYLLQSKLYCSCGSVFGGRHKDNSYVCRSQKYASGCKVKSVKMNWIDEEIKKQLFENYSDILRSGSQMTKKTNELLHDINYTKEKLAIEKRTQNNLLNAIGKISEQEFNRRYDRSKELAEQLETNLKQLQIRYSHTREVSRTFAGQELDINDKGESFVSRTIIDNELVRKSIERIIVGTEQIAVELTNGSKFDISRPQKTKH